MPRPFVQLSLDQFANLLVQFPWKRKVNEVHVHHTFRPNHADFASRPPVQSIEGMYRYHTEQLGWSDIAQHVTIDPTGAIWTGRNWNAPPASSTGFNGNSIAGPFMFEMIGDFDAGHDRFEGMQQETAIEVSARVQQLFGLDPKDFRFHNEMCQKTCPGTAIKKADMLDAVREAHESLGSARALRKTAAATRALDIAGQLLQMFAADPSARILATGEELAEDGMSLREANMSGGDLAAFGARELDTRDLSSDDRTLLRKHVINLRMGAFSSGGEFQTTQEDVETLFNEHLPTFLDNRKKEDPLKIVFFAHGGLNAEDGSLKNARNRIPFYTDNHCYPIFFVWETGVKETLVDILGNIIGFQLGRGISDTVTSVTDSILEATFRNAGFSMWANMKLSAERAFLAKQGGTFLVEKLAEFWRAHSTDVEIHAIGHSAGSIFHAYFIDLLCRQAANPPIEVKSLHFLAPAITTDLFKDKLMPLVGGRLKKLMQYTMHKDLELADSVGPYRKSLLYLVSRSFEDSPETPILGLEESIRRDPDLIRFFGLLGTQPKAEILFSVMEDGPSHSTISKTHGDFDNDRLTMASVMRSILDIGDNGTIVEFPETVSRNILNMPPKPGAVEVSAPFAAAFASSSTTKPVRSGGARRAICVGIDDYDPPNRLAGCVNDSNAWAAWLRGLGFETSTLQNRAATWSAMRDVLRSLISGSKPGDVLVFQYAGHGTQVTDLDGDEHGGKDSALCPVDFPLGSFLIDDDVRRIFENIPDGVNVTCFFDCCHSGTITRMLAPRDTLPAGSDVRTRGLFATPEMLIAHKQFRDRLGQQAPTHRGPVTMREVSFAACTDAQTAKEMDGHGAFTVRALDILKGGIDGLTHAAFLSKVTSAFSGTSDQSPQLDCSPMSRTLPLLAPLVAVADVDGHRSIGMNDILARLDDLDLRLHKLGV